MNELLYNFLAWIQGIVGSWGVALIIFTVLIRAALTPLDMKSRMSMRRTQKLQPQLQALQKKYAKDRDKLNAKTAELYKKEKINPLSSCLPLLLTWPILIIVFNAMRLAANREMLNQVTQLLNGVEPTLEPFLWVKNLWMPDNLFSNILPDAATLRAIPVDQWQRWLSNLQDSDLPELITSLGLTSQSTLDSDMIGKLVEGITALPRYQEVTTTLQYTVPLFNWAIPVTMNEDKTAVTALCNNGWLILPILSALSQVVMTKITTKGQPQQAPVEGQPNTGKFMQWFFPIFSLWICLTATASFALYWVAGNLVSMAQTVIINRILDKREAMAAQVAGEGTVK